MILHCYSCTLSKLDMCLDSAFSKSVKFPIIISKKDKNNSRFMLNRFEHRFSLLGEDDLFFKHFTLSKEITDKVKETLMKLKGNEKRTRKDRRLALHLCFFFEDCRCQKVRKWNRVRSVRK